MRIKILLLIAVVLLGLLLLATASGRARTSTDQWEYKVVATFDEKELNSLGGQGWELVSVDSGRGDHVRAFLKRRK